MPKKPIVAKKLPSAGGRGGRGTKPSAPPPWVTNPNVGRTPKPGAGGGKVMAPAAKQIMGAMKPPRGGKMVGY